MNYDTSSVTSNDEIVSIHNAYKKEFGRLNNEHQRNLNSLEECYKEQILCIIKEKDSVSLQLLTIFQSLYEHFQQKLKKLEPKNDKITNKSGDKINCIKETYQCIINGYENKQQDLFKEILELKKIIMEEKKININVSSIDLLEKENSIFKPNLKSNNLKRSKPELITGVLIWCLGVIVYQKKDTTSKENPRTEYLLELVLVITMIWHLGKFGEDRRLGLLNLVICGVICCILGFSKKIFNCINFFLK